jgi:GT2 family glycosyltransferase
MMDQHQPVFSIIIPTYERPVELVDCLEALAHLQFPRDAFEVIVVDNASSDGSSAMVESEFPQAQVILNATNCGFGAAHALHRDTGMHLDRIHLPIDPRRNGDEGAVDTGTSAVALSCVASRAVP